MELDKDRLGRYSRVVLGVIVVLYIVLGRLNRHVPWDATVADPAAKKLLLDVRMLHVSVGTVPQQS